MNWIEIVFRNWSWVGVSMGIDWNWIGNGLELNRGEIEFEIRLVLDWN